MNADVHLLPLFQFQQEKRGESRFDSSMGVSFHRITVNLRDEDRKFLYIPLGLYLLKLWGLARFFLTTYLSDETLQKPTTKTVLLALLHLQSFGASAQAILICVVFCFFDETVRAELITWCRCCCYCCCFGVEDRMPIDWCKVNKETTVGQRRHLTQKHSVWFMSMTFDSLTDNVEHQLFCLIVIISIGNWFCYGSIHDNN